MPGLFYDFPPMKFAIVVQGSPYSSQSCHSALSFAEALIRGGHELLRVFFYHDGVLVANRLTASPQDEQDIGAAWQTFAEQNEVELVACIASCLRRGILDENEAARYEKGASSIAPNFMISGLGQLIDATINADRVVTFGA